MLNEREKYLEFLNAWSPAIRLEVANEFIEELMSLRKQLAEVVACAREYCFEPPFDIEDRDVILNRRHANFAKLALMVRDFK